MKTVNNMPPFSAQKFIGKTHAALEAQVMYAGIELDLFKKMRNPISARELAKQTDYDVRNLELLLNALTAIGLLEKKGGFFSNLIDTDYYLNPESEMYIGEHILYWRDMTNLENITELVRKGPEKTNFKDENGSDFFDFRSMGQGARNTMYLGRVQKFIDLIRNYFKEDQAFKVFDMGGGSGIMSIEIARTFTNAECVVFDQPVVIELTQEIIKDYGVSKQVKTLAGNFITDSFEDRYDIIIASGVLDFVGDLDKMAKKLFDSLNDGGYIYVNTHGINKEFTAPSNFILGWLSSHLNGLDILKPDAIIKSAIENAGLEIIYQDKNKRNYIARKNRHED